MTNHSRGSNHHYRARSSQWLTVLSLLNTIKHSCHFFQTCESEETNGERNVRKTFNADPPPRFNLANSSPYQPTLAPKQNRAELIVSSPEREEGLNFGKLTGGFRRKGYNYPSLGKNQFDSFISNEETKATMILERKNTKPDLQSTSDTDSSEEEKII